MKSSLLTITAIAFLSISACKKVGHEPRRVYGQMIGDSSLGPIAHTSFKLSVYGTLGGQIKNSGDPVERPFVFTTDAEGRFEVAFKAKEDAQLYIMPVDQMLEDQDQPTLYWQSPANRQWEFNLGQIRIPEK